MTTAFRAPCRTSGGRCPARPRDAHPSPDREVPLLAQQLTNGLVLGSIYALSALGFTLIFGAARVVNFAYGELLMIGAFFTVALMSFAGIGFFIALPIAMLGVAALSVAMFYAAVRPLMKGRYTSLHSELQI